MKHACKQKHTSTCISVLCNPDHFRVGVDGFLMVDASPSSGRDPFAFDGLGDGDNFAAGVFSVSVEQCG